MKKVSFCGLFAFAVLCLSMIVACSKDKDNNTPVVNDTSNAIELFQQKLVGSWKLYSSYSDNYKVTTLVDDITDKVVLESYGELVFKADGTFENGLKGTLYYVDNSRYIVEEWNKGWADRFYDFAIRIINSQYSVYNFKYPAEFIDSNTLKWENGTGYYVYKRK